MTPQAQRAICMALVLTGTVLGLCGVIQTLFDRDEIREKTPALERELHDKHNIATNHAQFSEQLQEMREMLDQLKRSEERRVGKEC